MYKDDIQSVILSRMLERVNAKFDKREGSIIWDALAPAAVEFENFYYLLTAVLNEVFADTASRRYLIRRCAERGITPKQASYATVRAEFTPTDVEIPVDSRFSHEDYNYIVTEKVSDGVYLLQCETIGTEVNGVTGQLIPISYIESLETAYITQVVIPGEDEEDTETLRNRYMTSLQAEDFGGNRLDYENKVLSISGVGAVKIYSGSEWNGGGTVKIVIVDSNNNSPSEELVDKVQDIIDPACATVTENGKAGDGSGDGIAPIGHFVTVVGAYNTAVNVDMTLSYAKGYSWDSVKGEVEKIISSYFDTLNESWSSSDMIRVRISQIESKILNIPGIVDIQQTKLGTNKKPLTEENLVVDKDSIISIGEIHG